MAPTVQLLDETLVDQIAAGEVIERPANLVKELLENAIDAGATAITVSIEDGGRASVRVRDDGIGMSAEDASLSIQRHATSKISSFDDLVHVRTLGFRGEALPSIGAVSRMSIATRRSGDIEGTEIRVEGGHVRSQSPCGCPDGTTVVVEDLFYNVPARKKFLRARQSETSKIFEVCQRTALIHPELRLEVASDGRTARQYLPTTGILGRAREALGETALDEIRATRDGLELEAVLGPVAGARLGPRNLFLYVNGRPVIDRQIARAVAFAYGDRLPPGHYPRGIVSLRLPEEDVDVNAHPQKTEVRFKHGARILDSLTRMLGGRLGTKPSEGHYWRQRLDPPAAEAATSAPSTLHTASQVSEDAEAYRSTPVGIRLIAQLRDRYLVCEEPRRVLLLDRQRAETAVQYDQLRHAAEQGPLSSSPLLFPDRLELEAMHRDALDAHAATFKHLGFEWSALGERSYALRAVPALTAARHARAVFLAAIESILEPTDNARNLVLAAVARANSTEPGQPMDRLDASNIVAHLSLDDPAHRKAVVDDLFVPPEEPIP
ncbi:MAG: DNA mismatch repair endonuclease MutL [Polyangiales bacterium]